MKIAFTGASSTGKTTTAQELFNSGLLAQLDIEIIRPLNTRAGLTKKIDDLSHQERIAYQQKRFDEKKILEKNRANFITERSFIDLLAYRYAIIPTPTQDEIDEHVELANEYTVHFFFPHGLFPYELDGTRPDYSYSLNISRKIEEIMHSNHIKYIPLESNSLDKRCEIIANEILNLKNLKISQDRNYV